MFMDPEHVINLFDSYWFSYEILKRKPNDWQAKTSDISEPKFSSLRSILVRSQSEDIGSSFNYGFNSFFSPNSILKTIPSGKLDFTTQKQDQDQVVEEVIQPETAKVNDDHEMEIKKKKKKKRRHGMSKSLSDLEFEELKGFMDMGFVFSEQDSKDSSLVEIIPGLQRLGEEREVREQDDDGDDDIDNERRPYLSEAWEDLDRKLKKKEDKRVPQMMMKWEIPVAKDEIDMKDNLKLWAHTVASIVR
ncbi:uncharacterized protein LOC143625115 [Bidens hawaiensis]|uniref:uncharacterized protein LOC143625115 n=1 Tax=Bidens hawaiensis TaxID=980011 RepID=UPI00404B770B